jgi:hypothetical protein
MTPPPQRISQTAAVPPPPPFGPSLGPSLNFDDDILGHGSEPPGLRVEASGSRASQPPPMRIESSQARGDAYFRQVFDQFVSTKRRCNEPIGGLVYERFAEKLVKNREDLMIKTGCRDVRFTVYVKDGKAALKATPVKDDA